MGQVATKEAVLNLKKNNTNILTNTCQFGAINVGNMSVFSFPVSSEEKQISQSVHLILHILSLDHGCHDNNMAVPSILVGGGSQTWKHRANGGLNFSISAGNRVVCWKLKQKTSLL